MKIIDAHLHFGHLSDSEYVTPKEVKEFLTRMNVSHGFVMSTPAKGGNDNMEQNEQWYAEAQKEGLGLILYANATMVRTDPTLKSYLKFPFQAIKIHPWQDNYTDEDVEIACKAVENLGLPLMIHTGYDDVCHCERFRPFIKNHPNLIFVLCHARPSEEAFPMMREFPNLWVDTAFLPFRELAANISEDVEDRIMFGSDFPANRWFPFLGEETAWYMKQITDIQEKFSEKTAEKILYGNFERLYGELKF